jgi:hypothetical protein
LNPGRRGGKPATNRLSYGAACPEPYRYTSVLNEPYLCGIATALLNSGELIPHLLGGHTDNILMLSPIKLFQKLRTVTFSPQRICLLSIHVPFQTGFIDNERVMEVRTLIHEDFIKVSALAVAS